MPEDELLSVRGVRFKETIITGIKSYICDSRWRSRSATSESAVPAPVVTFSFLVPEKTEKVSYQKQQQQLKQAFETCSIFNDGLLLDTREKGVLYPVVHLSYRGELSETEEYAKLTSGFILHQGLYEEVRNIVPETELPQVAPIPQNHRNIGYILLGFKSLDRKFSQVMVDTWKDWTGARYIYMYLPDDLGLRRITFYHRQQPDNLDFFMYIVIVECHGITSKEKQVRLLDFAQRMRLERMTGYISVYTGETRELDSLLSPKDNMEILTEGKNFRLAQQEELPEILAFLEKYLPESIKFHQTLRTYLEDFIWDFHFYISKNWPEDPICLHFPGMTSSPNGRMYESFSVFFPESRPELLQQLQEEDILLDWSQPVYLNFTHNGIVERLEKFYQDIGTLEKVQGDVYICLEAVEDFPADRLEIDPEVEIRELELGDVPTIHDLYPANDMEAIGVFQTLVTKLPAYGVFCNGDLAAWMVQSYYGAMFSMQTRPEFRRRGYGLHLARRLTLTVKQRGYIPYVVIRPENEASKALYTKLGFQQHFQTVRVIFQPYGYNEELSIPHDSTAAAVELHNSQLSDK